LAGFTRLPFDREAAARFLKLRKQGVRIGTMDLRIACIVMEHDALLLTRNTVDFEKVPGLKFENWAMPSSPPPVLPPPLSQDIPAPALKTGATRLEPPSKACWKKRSKGWPAASDSVTALKRDPTADRAF